MEIVLDAIVDSASHLGAVATDAELAVVNLREQLQVFQDDWNNCESSSTPGDLTPFPSSTTSIRNQMTMTLVQASFLVDDLAFVLEAIQEDVREAVEDVTRNARANLASTTCRADYVAGWVRNHYESLEEYAARFDGVLTEVAFLEGRLGSAMGGSQ